MLSIGLNLKLAESAMQRSKFEVVTIGKLSISVKKFFKVTINNNQLANCETTGTIGLDLDLDESFSLHLSIQVKVVLHCQSFFYITLIPEN